ncbi:hypothetical protein V6O07_18790, partial [Arthrospira platensis SPKY2]
ELMAANQIRQGESLNAQAEAARRDITMILAQIEQTTQQIQILSAQNDQLRKELSSAQHRLSERIRVEPA